MNPMEILSMIRGGANPQQVVLKYLEGNLSNTPMGANLLNLAKSNNKMEIEKIARNLTAQRGVDYDQAFAQFKKSMGIR